MGKEVFLKNVRICYAQNLFTPSSAKEGQPKKFNCQVILPKEDTAQIKMVQDAILEVARGEWDKQAETVIKSLKNTDFICLRDGENKPDREEVQGSFFLAASNRKRPTTLNRDRSPVTEEDGIIYSGCYVNIKVEVYAYVEPEMKKKMIPASLLGVQFVKDGDAFAGGAKVASADEFDDISNTGEADSAADDGSSLF